MALLLPLVLFLACGEETGDLTRRPNVVLIMTDDQGYGDLGFHGNPDIRTPVLDSLARRSTRFSQFYVSPVCSPTRASLLTGRYSLRTGVYDTYLGGASMATEEVTLAEILLDAGYATGIFGKWHLGNAHPFRPQDQGFAETLVHPGGGIGQAWDADNYFKGDYKYFDPILHRNGEKVQTTGYCSDVFTDAALAFIESHRERPFFLYLSYNAPHGPLQVPDDYYALYEELEIDPSRYPQAGQSFPDMSDWSVDAARRVYGMVSNIDDNVGRVLDLLAQLGLTERTLIIFLTDNGPAQPRYNGGLLGRKGLVYEGGIRVPFFMYWPGKLPEDREIAQYAAHIDLLPTVLDLAGISLPGGVELDGRSLVGAIEGESVSWADRPLFFHWGRGLPEPYRNVAVRRGAHKLVAHTSYEAELGEFQLFDIARDPFEITDISAAHEGVVADLKGLFDRWYEEVIRSPALGSKYIRLGTPHQDPVLLNRNDAKGDRDLYNQEQIYGYWDVSVGQDGLYTITFHFIQTLPGQGSMTLKAGNTQRTIENADSTDMIRMENVPLYEGEYMLESWYYHQGNRYMPFYVIVERQG
jgi:arylsulfatase